MQGAGPLHWLRGLCGRHGGVVRRRAGLRDGTTRRNGPGGQVSSYIVFKSFIRIIQASSKEYTVYPTENGQHPPCHLKLSCLTQPLPACLVGSYTDRQSKERLLNLRRRGDRILSVLSRIYSIFFGFEAAIKQLC